MIFVAVLLFTTSSSFAAYGTWTALGEPGNPIYNSLVKGSIDSRGIITSSLDSYVSANNGQVQYDYTSTSTPEFITTGISNDRKQLTWIISGRAMWARPPDLSFTGEVGGLTQNNKTGIASIPFSGTVWLLGSGILGLVGLKRRKVLCK
jgi:hypothetical protein